ncbi:MAG: elongation factor P [Patescibacteria group bacterium]
MLSATELRKGIVFTHENSPQLVLDYKHVKSARGGAIIRVKCKNLKNGVVREITLNNGNKVEEADIERKTFDYLYKDASAVHLTDVKSHEQIDLPLDLFEGQEKFLKDGVAVTILFFADTPLSPQLPLKLEFKVVYTEPGYAGNTSTTVYKDAEIETGAVIKVPLFIKIGETILVNTSTGGYVSRA